MNRFIVFIAIILANVFCANSAFGQVGHEFVPGEVIVKLRHSESITFQKSKGRISVLNSTDLNAIFESLGVTEFDELTPDKNTSSRVALLSRSANQMQEGYPNGIYHLKFDNNTCTVRNVIDKLQSCPEVEYAEPNYVVRAMVSSGTNYISNDPLSTQQWALNAINMPMLWTQTPIKDNRPIIAILDTGVDIGHLDLCENIWVNNSERNGSKGYDDDGNGYADDIHGWDFVNNSPNIRDDNGHGTHCAGIAAAVGNNEIGIIGANPDALIMPITVMGRDGSGDLAMLIKGVNYAIANGADVLSMSLGFYGESKAVEDVMREASQKAILVAAAGNDNICMIAGHQALHGDRTKAHEPCFPAAYSFVWGVEASDQSGLASFSNFDCDGSTTSSFAEHLYNYELRAPGMNILSTYIHGQYKALSGTSMACPLVAGAVSRLIQLREYSSNEELLGDLIQTSSDNIDASAVFALRDELRTPSLQFITYEMYDPTGDEDGECDAGEEISLYPTIRNMYGYAKNITFSLSMDENEDPNIIEILDNNVDLGYSLGTYGKAKSQNPLKFRISKDCADNRVIRLVMKAKCDNTNVEFIQKLSIVVTNAIELKGAILNNTTLYPGKEYVLTNDVIILNGATLTLEPGTVLSIRKGKINSTGNIIAKGTPDNPITIKNVGTQWNSPYSADDVIFTSGVFEYVNLEAVKFKSGDRDTCYYTNCRIYDSFIKISRRVFLNKCNIIRSETDGRLDEGSSTSVYDFSIPQANNNYINNIVELGNTWAMEKSNLFANHKITGEECNVIIDNPFKPCEEPVGLRHCYYGSADLERVKKGIYDLYNPAAKKNFYCTDYSTISFRPSSEAHGIVWKVLVDGVDAQDETEQLLPLGVGRHKFDVYFNRPMDKAFPPSIYMGVVVPYTQISISEDGEWNADGSVFTAYLTINGETESEGLNRIFIYGAKDLEHFEIPEEKYRFNVMVQSAGALETGLVAVPERGRILLEWETKESDFPDMQGYNLYRYTQREETYYEWGDNENGVYGRWEKTRVVNDTILLNKQLLNIGVTTYTDFDVEPGKTYFYFVKEMYTDLTQSAISNTVAVKPLFADLGDANGSGSVDIADVITDVAYISRQDPQPFIFEAADVNGDEEIDVRDIVETVNMILRPSSMSVLTDTRSCITIENGTLKVISSIPLGGVQVVFNSNEMPKCLTLIKGMEQNCMKIGQGKTLYMAYSLSGNCIPAEGVDLLQLGNDASIEEIILCDTRGKKVYCDTNLSTQVGGLEFSVDEADRVVVCDLYGRILFDGSLPMYRSNTNWKKYISKGIYVESIYSNGALIKSNKLLINN